MSGFLVLFLLIWEENICLEYAAVFLVLEVVHYMSTCGSQKLLCPLYHSKYYPIISYKIEGKEVELSKMYTQKVFVKLLIKISMNELDSFSFNSRELGSLQ